MKSFRFLCESSQASHCTAQLCWSVPNANRAPLSFGLRWKLVYPKVYLKKRTKQIEKYVASETLSAHKAHKTNVVVCFVSLCSKCKSIREND